MTEIDVNQLLAQMHAMAAQAKGEVTLSTDITAASDFSALLQQSIAKVNATQQEAGKLAQAFDTGDPGVDLAEVMVALQKASISFQAMTQVRNRLVSAYQEIMNFQV